MLAIRDLRFRFTASCSSDHHVIEAPRPERLGAAEDESVPGEFGWEYFVLTSRAAKRRYLKSISAELRQIGRAHV